MDILWPEPRNFRTQIRVGSQIPRVEVNDRLLEIVFRSFVVFFSTHVKSFILFRHFIGTAHQRLFVTKRIFWIRDSILGISSFLSSSELHLATTSSDIFPQIITFLTYQAR